jgi:hypothetical protein
MPRASPGVITRGQLRRVSLSNIGTIVGGFDWHHAGRPTCLWREIYSHPYERWLQKRYYFTQHLSGIGFGCGRLGEVESLVGDCRPPPPGNPRRPFHIAGRNWRGDEMWNKTVESGTRFYASIPITHHHGGIFLTIAKYYSFNRYQKTTNLKRLIHPQYFKNNCSYFSCTEKGSVLEFLNFHYHLYGDWLVKPPSIAITNVLDT